MIDEKKLIEDIEKEIEFEMKCNMPDIVAGMRQIASVIEEQPKIGEWIPCSERLPEPIRPVLVTLKNWMNDKCFVRVGRFHTDHWKTDEGIVENSVVLAWQPLPQPFQKGE